MNVIDTLTQRNEAFASSRFSAELKIIPSLKTMIIGCVDPRVDPVDIFGLAPGEAAVIRNVGGRINSGNASDDGDAAHRCQNQRW
jgi:carbonic anhydrase